MKRFIISAAFALMLIGHGSNALGPEDAYAQPADVGAVAEPAGAPETPATTPADPAPESDVPRETIATAAGGATSPPADGARGETAETGVDDLAVQLLAAIRSGEWLPAFGLALMLLIAGLRHWFLGSWIPWLKTRRGGYVLAFGTAAVAVFGTALAAGGGLTMGLVGVAFGAGWAAIGMYQTGKDAAAGGD